MSNVLMVQVNGRRIEVEAGTTVAVAAMLAGQPCRISVTGAPRGPMCGMGICFECRVTINGKPHCRGCQILCEQGMDVRTVG